MRRNDQSKTNEIKLGKEYTANKLEQLGCRFIGIIQLEDPLTQFGNEAYRYEKGNEIYLGVPTSSILPHNEVPLRIINYHNLANGETKIDF